MARRPAAGRRHPLGLTGEGDRYGLLLLLLVVTYVLSAFLNSPVFSATQVLLFIAALLLALRSAQVRGPVAVTLIATVLIGSAAAVPLALDAAGMTGKGIAAVWTGLILLATVATIVRRILAHPVITLQSIYGAVSAYLIIGLMFASFYKAIDHLGGVPFFSPGEAGTTQTFQYFSFTTLTTLGYGDFTARSAGGQAVAVLEALAGQIFLATLIARLVASFRSGAQRAGGAQPARRPGAGRRDRPGASRRPQAGYAAQRRMALRRRLR